MAESSSNRKPQVSTPAREYHFVSVMGGESRTSAETLRLVHSHAQANYRRKNPRPHRHTTWELDVTTLLDRSNQSDLSATTRAAGGPVSLLSASRSDPFAAFGIEAGSRAHRLWAHVYDGTCPKFRTLIEIGFIDLVRETIAISQMLSASAWHLVHWCCVEDDTGEDARYSMITAQSLQQRLNNLATGTSNEVITTVLASAAYANLIKEPQIFQTHMDGLAQILLHRGGESTLDSFAALRLAMFWIELNGRLKQDVAPQYPPPYHILATRSKLGFEMTNTSVLSTEEVFDCLEESASVQHLCRQLRRLNEVIAEESSTHNLWQDAMFPVFHVSPILHDCLSMSRASLRDEMEVRQRECLRLASILYLIELRGKLDFEPGAGMLYGTKLQLMLGTPGLLPTWERSNNFLLWILTVAACSATLFDDLRAQFVSLLAESIWAAGIGDFEGFSATINGCMWSDVAFGQALRALQCQIAFQAG